MATIIFRYALRNIGRTSLRSFFTLFSIVLIITLYTVLTTIGNSFTQQVSKMLEEQSIDIAVQAKYAVTPVSSVIPAKSSDEIAQLEGVKSVEVLVIGRKRIEGKKSIFVMGVSDVDAFSHQLGFNLQKGRMMGEDKNEIVVGERMASIFNLESGSTLELGNKVQYRVVGVYASWLNFLNTGLLMELHAAQQLLLQPDKINMLFVTLNDPTDTSAVIEQIRVQYPSLRAIESTQLPDYLGPVKNLFYFSNIVSVLTLIIAISVLLNTFIMAIAERTREIGILSAIGWSRNMIVILFFTESLLLSCTGGVIGYGLSFPLMALLQELFPSIYMYLPSAPTAATFAEILMITVLIAFLSILFPALYGTKIQIAKAIRHE